MHFITLHACLLEPTTKIWMQIDQYCKRQKCRPVTNFARSPWRQNQKPWVRPVWRQTPLFYVTVLATLCTKGLSLTAQFTYRASVSQVRPEFKYNSTETHRVVSTALCTYWQCEARPTVTSPAVGHGTSPSFDHFMSHFLILQMSSSVESVGPILHYITLWNF